MCSCDGDLPKIYNENIVKARKQHVCCECGSIIDHGEKYHITTGLWDTFETYRQCLTCRAVWDEAQDKIIDLCIPYESLWETVGVKFEYAAANN